MGLYINSIDGLAMGPGFESKCLVIKMHGGVETDADIFQENLVCVVDNGPFAAAGYAYSEQEWAHFKSYSSRKKKWFLLPNAKEHVDQ
jgi:hypothetical protein